MRDLFSLVDGTKTTTNLWGRGWVSGHYGMRNGVIRHRDGCNARDNHPISVNLDSLAGEGFRVGRRSGTTLDLLPAWILNCCWRPPRETVLHWSALKPACSRTVRGRRAAISAARQWRRYPQGARTEIDFFNGRCPQGAKRLCRVYARALVEVVKKVERGDLAPAHENLLICDVCSEEAGASGRGG